MTRGKSFDRDETLDRAIALFWSRGYEATSMQDLVECMGIGRGSLYDTYGGKRQLFLSALRRYDHHHRAAWTDRLAREQGPRAAILAAFREVAEAILHQHRRQGCLLVNTALELSPHDAEIAGVVRNALAEMEDFFRDRIETARAAGKIAPGRPAAETAAALLALIVALRVFARARPEPALIASVVDQAEALLPPPDPIPNQRRTQ